jgi:hypothetical protein
MAYAVGICGDIFVTIALADSLFFSVGPHAARPRVLLYLLLTMAPFAVVAPVLGPLLDRTRGGRRLLFAASHAGRCVLCLLMADNVHTLLLYPFAFASLVCSKGQTIAKSSLVPAVVEDDSEFVRANSRLALVAVVAGAVGGIPAAGILKAFGGAWVLRVASVVFFVGTFVAFRIPKAEHLSPSETDADRRALHAPSIVVASSAMALLRGVVGFVTFFAAFVLKSAHEPAWVYGALILASAIGNGSGTLLAPELRKKLREEWILVGSLVVPGVLLIFLARSYGRPQLLAAGFLIAAGAAAGRLAFDSLVQRDGAEAARGRAFARYETRFQLVWVGGGVFAVLFPGGGRAGIFLVAMVLLAAGLSYLGAVRRPGGIAAPRERDWRADASRVMGRWRDRRPNRPDPAPEDPPEAFPSGS